MQTILVLKGLPASGKSTYAKEFVKNNDNYIRVNRDDLRHMCGEYWVPKREPLITKLEQISVETAIKEGYNVVLDATNFNPKVMIWVSKIASEHGCEIVEHIMTTPLEECLKRDKGRIGEVGKSVIEGMYNKYLKDQIL